MTELDPVRLAQRQRELDAGRTQRFPALAERKRERMSTSALGFLRGSAPLFYEILAAHPDLADGPDGQGWLVGDAHLENFGAYRVREANSPNAEKKPCVFDLNDFDDAVPGPWRWDVLRLVTSLLVAGTELRIAPPRALDLASALVDSYVASACSGFPLPAAPAPVRALLDQVRARSKKQFLDARTAGSGERRRFIRGPRYADLSAELRSLVSRAFSDYVESIASEERPRENERTLVDAAFRIAGTGSLGSLRVAVLTLGKSEASACIFDLKEMGTPSAAPLVKGTGLTPAERVLTACRACLDQPPRMLGTTRIEDASLFARRLLPQEDRLELDRTASTELEPLVRHLAALLGRAHRRGASALPARAWSAGEQSALIERAATLAGVHLATHYAYCALSRAR